MFHSKVLLNDLSLYFTFVMNHFKSWQIYFKIKYQFLIFFESSKNNINLVKNVFVYIWITIAFSRKITDAKFLFWNTKKLVSWNFEKEKKKKKKIEYDHKIISNYYVIVVCWKIKSYLCTQTIDWWKFLLIHC